jgi:AraC-like DNA-binding protein
MLSFISLFGALQCAILAVAFAAATSPARRLFAALAFNLGLILGAAVLMEGPLIATVPHLARVHLPLNYLIAPLFYLFVRASLGHAFEGRRAVWHALPALVVALTLIPFYALPAAAKLAAIGGPSLGNTLRLATLLIQGLIYLMMTLRLLRRAPAPRELWACFGVMALLFSVAVLRLLTGISALWIPSGFALWAMALAAIRMRTREPQPAAPKYARSTLGDDRAARALGRLTALMDSERLYLDPDLSLDTVAAKSGIPSHHVSQLINQRLGCNFNDWVNGHRVEEAKGRLHDRRYAHQSIVAIAEGAGFRSKSTFNVAFRKTTGVTPSAFRRAESPEQTSGIMIPDNPAARPASS